MGLYTLLIPISLVLAIVALVSFPFTTTTKVTGEGLEFVRRVSGLQRLVAWSELDEVLNVDSAPHPTYIAVLKDGEKITVPSPNAGALQAKLAANGIPCRIVDESALTERPT
jgi:hypothetical protein